MMEWPAIPEDVVSWFRTIFAEANRSVCERLVNLPNIRETSLDDGLIEALVPDSAPTLLPSGAIVQMDIHNIGGLRRISRWEVADIAILVFVFRREQLMARKIGLLQAKRLYPTNNDVIDEDEEGFRFGMNAFIGREVQQALAVLQREYAFNDQCVYGSIRAGDPQLDRLEELNRQFGKTAFYLLYNPALLPVTVHYPLKTRTVVSEIDIGCRVVDSDRIRDALSGLEKGQTPSYRRVNDASGSGNWPLQTWAADMLLKCQVGQQFDETRDGQITSLLTRRSGPIGAALAVSITLPD